ncbi:MAG: L,D-transpeptidase Cds6 family protein [Gammaproteobacteria bacterium]
MPVPPTFTLPPIVSFTTAWLLLALPTSARADAADDARRALERGNHERALHIIGDALKERPDSAQLRLLHALALDAKGQTGRAIAELEALIGEFPAEPAPYNNLARIHARRGDLDKARATLERGIAGNSEFATLYGNLNTLFEAQARVEYAKALDVKGQSAQPALSPILAMTGETDEPSPRAEVAVARARQDRERVSVVQATESPSTPAIAETPVPWRSQPDPVAPSPPPAAQTGGTQVEANNEPLADETMSGDAELDLSGMRVAKLRLPPERATRPEAAIHDPIISNKVSIADAQPDLSAPIDPVPDTRPERARKPAPVVLSTAANRPTPAPAPASGQKSETDPAPVVEAEPIAVIQEASPRESVEENGPGATRDQVLSQSLPLPSIDTAVAEGSTARPGPALEREPERAKPTSTPVVPVTRDDDAIETLEGWAAAWSAQDVDSYLSFYGADFKAPRGNRAAWAELRRKRLSKPKWIKVALDRFRVQRLGDDRVRVRVEQDYRSNTFNSTVTKIFEMGLENSEWRIVSERVDRR